MNISLGYSPCPNDSFIFYAISAGIVAADINWQIRLEDVEALNQLAKNAVLELTKISYHAYGHLAKDYIMLNAGGALGKGVGPLIVTAEPLPSLENKTIAIPGELTTANLLLKLSQNDSIKTVTLRYDKIMPAVAAGQLDAGLIIHESRFTFADYGLQKFLDLGSWWEEETGHLLPLGGIIAKRSIGNQGLLRINAAIKESIAYSYKNPSQAQPYIAEHATEMSKEVMQKHIDLYVNDYSIDVGEAGKAAVRELFARAQSRGFIPPIRYALFLD